MPILARDVLYVGAPGLLLMAPGGGAILGGLTPSLLHTIPRPHQLLLFLAGGFASSIYIRCLGKFSASLLSLFFAGGFQTDLPLFDRHAFASLHGRKHRGRIMSLLD